MSYEKVLGQGSYGTVEKHGDAARKYTLGKPSEGINSFTLNEMLSLRMMETHSISYVVNGYYLISGDTVEFTINMPLFGMPLDHWASVNPFTVRANWVERNLSSLCRFVDHMHILGIMHGDIKPDNILLHGDGFVLIDYGSSRINMRGGMAYLNAASPYRAPEYDASSQINVEADYWALAATIYYVLRKQSPRTSSELAAALGCNLVTLSAREDYYRNLDNIMECSIFSEETRNIMRRCYSYDRRKRITPYLPSPTLDESDINPRYLPDEVYYVNKELTDEEYYRLISSQEVTRLGIDIWDRYLSCHKCTDYALSLRVCNIIAQKILTYKGTVMNSLEIQQEKRILEALQYILVHRRASRQHKWFQTPLPSGHRTILY